MKQRGLDEEAAYKLLRKGAMDRNLRIPDLAKSIIAAAELIG
jgi:response regulator NasT